MYYKAGLAEVWPRVVVCNDALYCNDYKPTFESCKSSSEIRSGGQVTFQKRMSDGVRGRAPREIFPPFASK